MKIRPIGLIGLIGLIGPILIFASGAGSNIDNNDANEHWVWNDVIGWSDWHDTYHNIIVGGRELRGYADSVDGPIILNCATTPDGNICSSSDFKVSNDGNGNLAGYAWNEVIGWIDFSCTNTSSCSDSNFQVKVRNGYFENYAWNDIVGWFDFSCLNTKTSSQCAADFPDWLVQTTAGTAAETAEFTSNIFDAGSSDATFNTILWQGSQNGGTVEFRIATSNSGNGPWTYGSWFTASRGTPTALAGSGTEVVGRRYLRYQARLSTDLWQTASPVIDDIIINYSP